MAALHCAEHDYPLNRPTHDADIVLELWADSGILNEASRVLDDHGFAERDDAIVDLLMPENGAEQRKKPRAHSMTDR